MLHPGRLWWYTKMPVWVFRDFLPKGMMFLFDVDLYSGVFWRNNDIGHLFYGACADGLLPHLWNYINGEGYNHPVIQPQPSFFFPFQNLTRNTHVVFYSHPEMKRRFRVSDLWVPTVGFLEDEHFSLKSIRFVARQGQSALIGSEAKRLSIWMGFHWCF